MGNTVTPGQYLKFGREVLRSFRAQLTDARKKELFYAKRRRSLPAGEDYDDSRDMLKFEERRWRTEKKRLRKLVKRFYERHWNAS